MRNLRQHTDDELLELMRLTDEGAFVEVFNRYNSLLLNFAYIRLRDTEEAKDVVQDVFLNLWNNRTHLEPGVKIGAYLYRSVLNRILNIFKHANIQERYIATLEEFMNESNCTTDHLVREKTIEEMIEKEIAALPSQMKNVFVMRRILVKLISEYEDKTSELPNVDPIELINIRMEEFGCNSKELALAYGDKGTVSKVLN